jgi:hypothetical protein
MYGKLGKTLIVKDIIESYPRRDEVSMMIITQNRPWNQKYS